MQNKAKHFCRHIFIKPLKALPESTATFEVISMKKVENTQEVCNSFDEMHYDKESDACFNDLSVRFCESKTIKEMQDYS